MTNWKLGAFLIIALTLIASLFCDVAIAADGDGTIKVKWTDRTATLDPTSTNVFTNIPNGDPDPAPGDPAVVGLNAGSVRNALELTYTAEATHNMGGGLLRVTLPGWVMGTLADADNTATEHFNESALFKFVRITSVIGGTSVDLYYTSATALGANFPVIPVDDATLTKAQVDERLGEGSSPRTW